ncbi:MAG: hypothetical protein F9B45_29120 [Phycisphaera sp. RhM]|nr:hypothetical protein [Phycisphaera sp. RhM]
MADRCDACGVASDDLAVCFIDGERTIRCSQCAAGIIPAHDGEYGRIVPPEDYEIESDNEDETD